MKKKTLLQRFTLSLFGLGLLMAMQAQTPAFQSHWWKPDGDVHSVLIDGNTVYLGGLFYYLGPDEKFASFVDIGTGKPDTSWVNPDQTVYTAISDGSGGYFIGGSFTQVNGQPRARLARINSDGTLNAFNTGLTAYGTVWSLQLVGNTLYVAGDYNEIGGISRSQLSAIDITTGTVLPWNPNANARVYKLLVDGSTAYVAGEFTSVGGQSRNRIAALDINTGLATAWNPNADYFVWSMTKSGNTIYAAGFFNNIGGQPRSYLAAIDATTGLATAWNPAPSNGVMCVAVSGSTVYAGGFFTSIGGQPRQRLAALDATTGLATAWAPDPDQQVYSLEMQGGTLYAGGSFYEMSGQPRKSFAAFDLATGNLLPATINANQTLYAMVPAGSNIFVAGQYTSLGGVSRRYAAALDATTGEALPWNPNPNSYVESLAKAGSSVYLAGSFIEVGGQTRNYVAAVDATTGAVLPWNPNPNSQVMVLAADGGLVYTGGYFSSIGGQSRNFLAAIDASGNATAWNPNPDSYPLTLATSGGKVYVSGGFSNIGGQIRNQLAEIDAAGNATAWNPNPDGGVNDIDIDNNTLFVSGGFNNIAGSPRKYLAAFNLSTGNLNAWNPNPNSYNERLSAANGKVYVVGSFSEIGGQTRNGFAELDGTSGIISTFNTLNGSNILDIDANASYIVAGGANNISVDGNQVPFLAGFTQAAPPPACTGTPAPGNTIASLTTVCGNDNLSFSIQNAVVLLNASGITYQWQANTGSGFADINGAISNYYATSQLVTTTYRCKVTCTASSNVAYSTPVTVTQNALQDCYCTPIDYYGQYAYISNVTIGTINNTTTFESNYYGDYTAQVTNAGIGLPQTISIGNPYGAYVYAFIDYNQDGDFFDAGEMVVANTGSGPFTFTIPNTALAGNTRLRVAMSAYGNSYPCYTFNGETEDYTLNLIFPPACSGSPVPGNTLASLPAACVSDIISLSLQNIIANSGITYQWQANSGSGYADISGATSATHTASQSVATTYRCRVTCTNSGSVVYSTPVTVTQTVCYCTPTDYYGQYTYISNVSIGSINNSTGYENNYYGNYTSQLTYAQPGQSQNITIDIPYDAYIYVYVDYNQDGDFTDIDEIAVYNYGIGTQSFSFTVPVTATAGPCRMRIATSYYDNGGDACYTYYGESEDYTLFINANPIYVWTGAISTAWNNAGNWTPSGIPTATDDVIIPDLTNDPAIGFIPGSVNDINIADGVTISVNSGIALYINGNLTAGSGSGSTIAGAGGVVELNGSDAQQINGKLTVRTLRINNSSMGGVDVLGTLNITNGMIMIDGDVNANSGTVTLKSSASATAFLDNFSNVTAGTYSGDLTVERYIANTADGYRNISSPVNTTVADLADDMSISGADGVNCWYSYSPYPNVQVYEEAANNSLSTPSGNYYTGWISKTGTGNAMPAMKGFALRTYAGAPFTIDLTGTPYTGSKSADLTNTPSATPAQDGWNFIGNPFPSPISWANTEANNPGATTGSYYVFNTTGEYTGNWGVWNGSTGTNGATDNIGIMQGFFVRTTNPYNYVEANNASRVASATIPFFKSYSAQPNEIRLSLHDATNSDEIVAYTDGAATWSEDMGHDAVKIPAGSTVYMSYKQLGKEYAINVIDEITETTELPLVLWAQDTGTYTFEATELNVDGYITYLKDAELNTLTDLTTTASIQLPLNGGQTYEGRYSIVFEEVEIPSGIANINEGKTKIYSHRNIAVVERNNDQPATITITNTLGQTIKEVTTDSKRTEITLDNANAWYAIVKVKEANATQTGKVLIQ